MTYLALDSAKNPMDYAGRTGFNTAFGESVVGWRDDDISVSFQYSNSTMDVVPVVSGSGSTSNSNQQAVCAITTTAGTARVTSQDAVRYRPGHEITAQYTALFNGAQGGVTHHVGLFDANDGCGWGTQNGVFGVWLIDGGVKTFVPQSSFSDDKLDGTGPSGFILNKTNVNIYQVQYGWLGISPIMFSVYTGHDTGWVLAHVIDRVNNATVPHLNNPSLPMAMEVVRAAGTGTAADVRCSSWRAAQTGGGRDPNNADRWFSYTSLAFTPTAGARNNVFTIRSKPTYQGSTNHVTAEIAIVAFDNSLNKSMAIYGTKNGTLAGNSAYADINTANSVMEVSTGGTVSGGTVGPATVLKKDSELRNDVRNTGIMIYPGESFTFEVVPDAASTGTISISVRWIERF